ncbi:MAG: T9SS type A sorting domain-containing protein [Sphingobacteriales bacterium]|nr:MAG: T9SS type A sorting domain-containing protein [Sphingobacteriales bacterium]
MKQKFLHIGKLLFLCALFLSAGFSMIWGQATLPVNRTSSWGTAATGWTPTGISHRTSNFACSGSSAATFDNTNDRLIVFFNAAPDQLIYKLKGANMAGSSSMLVECSDNGSNWTTLGTYGTESGSTSITDCNDITHDLTATTRYIRWTYTKSAGNCDLDDVRITQATNCTAPSFTTQPANASRLVGNTATLTAAASNVTSYQWQWRTSAAASWANVTATQGTGGASNTFTTVAATQTMNGYQYRVIATNACGGGNVTTTTTSNSASLTVTCPAIPTITSQPVNSTVDLGTDAVFQVTANNAHTYQWQVWSADVSTWINIGAGAMGYSGQATNSLTVSTPDMNRNNARYRVLIANLCSQTANSAETTLTIDGGVVVTTNPASVLSTDQLTSITTYTNTGVGQILSEGIRYSTDGTNWSLLISGGQATNLLPNQRYYYRGYATFDIGTFYGISLDTFTLANVPGTPLLGALTGGTAIEFAIDVNGNPSTTTYAITTGTSWVQADGTLGINPVWEIESAWNNVTINGLNPQTNYCLAVKARNNDSIETATGTQDCIQTACAAIAITTQPLDQAVPEGSTATFEVSATGSNLLYDWQENKGSGWQAIVGNAHQLSITPVTLSMDAYQYVVTIRDNCSNVLNSDTVQLNVVYQPVIIVHPVDTLLVTEGQTAVFSVTAAGNNLSYQWEVSTDGGQSWSIIPGADNASYAVLADDNMNGNQYRVNVSNSEGVAVSDAGAITVIVPTPVTLLHFNAVKENNLVLLKWATAAEVYNKGFEVERSSNGREWHTIVSVASQSNGSNSTVPKNYTAKDESPLNGLNIYRLKQVDLDGSFSLSAVRKIYVDQDELIVIYPNPAQHILFLKGIGQPEAVRILNVNGHIVKHAEAVNEINIADLAAGLYTVQIVINGNHIVDRKLVITK